MRFIALVGLITTAVGLHAVADAPGTHGQFSLIVTKKFDAPIPRTPLSVAWSPDGSTLAVTSNYGGDLTILDDSGKKLSGLNNVSGEVHMQSSAAFINGTSQILFHPSEEADARTMLDVRDAATGKIIKSVDGVIPRFEGQRNSPKVIAVSPDQKLAAVIYGASIVMIYDTEDWRQLQKIDDYKMGVVLSLCFSPDGKQLAIGHNSGFTIIDPVSGKTIEEIESYRSKYGIVGVHSMAFSPDGRFLLTIAKNELINGNVDRDEARAWERSLDAIRIWRLSDGAPVKSFKSFAPKAATRPIRQGVWDPRGRFVAFIDHRSKLLIWQAMTPDGGYMTIDLSDPAYSLAIAPDGNSLAVTQNNRITVFNIQ